jgi:ABC transporter substrate binding protein
MADLVRRRVAVIATPAFTVAAPLAKAATTTIPIVFGVSEDPVKLGLVASFARPGGNATGINFFGLRSDGQATWSASRPSAQGGSDCRADQSGQCSDHRDHVTRDIRSCARPRTTNPDTQCQQQPRDRGGLRHHDARAPRCTRHRPRRFLHRPARPICVAAHHGMPAAYFSREFVEVGLMSYGSDISDAYRQVGVCTGQILKGAKPADLPVVQSTKFEFVINIRTAKALGLEVPPQLLASATRQSSSGACCICSRPESEVRPRRACRLLGADRTTFARSELYRFNPSGHERGAFAAMQGPEPCYIFISELRGC